MVTLSVVTTTGRCDARLTWIGLAGQDCFCQFQCLLTVGFEVPRVEQRQIFDLERPGEMKEIGMDRVAAARGAAMALPHRVPKAIDAVIIGDLFAGANGPQGEDVAIAAD